MIITMLLIVMCLLLTADVLKAMVLFNYMEIIIRSSVVLKMILKFRQDFQFHLPKKEPHS